MLLTCDYIIVQLTDQVSHALWVQADVKPVSSGINTPEAFVRGKSIKKQL